MFPIARSPCLGGPDRVTPEPIIVVTLSEDVVDISGAHPTHDLLKEVSFQTTREQQESLGTRGDVLTRYIASTLQVLGLKN